MIEAALREAYLHSTVVLLKASWVTHLLNFLAVFTFYCSSIKGLRIWIMQQRLMHLHSTVVLLKGCGDKWIVWIFGIYILL